MSARSPRGRAAEGSATIASFEEALARSDIEA
jgi:hypothetical protein